jgi:hypothetical protein
MLDKIKCNNNKCDSETFYIRDVKMHKGLYCFECGTFKKWTTKNEIYFLVKKGQIDGGDDYK